MTLNAKIKNAQLSLCQKQAKRKRKKPTGSDCIIRDRFDSGRINMH